MILRIAVWTCVFYMAINGLLELAIRLKRPGILGFTLQGSVVLFGLAWLVSYVLAWKLVAWRIMSHYR
jgi:hypothetical protein